MLDIDDAHLDRCIARRRASAGLATALLLAAGVTSVAFAQDRSAPREADPFLQQQRALDRRIDALLAEEDIPARDVFFDYGGWYSAHLLVFDDGVDDDRTLRRHDLRLWSRLTLEGGAHQFFLRVRGSYIDFNTGDAYDGNDDDWEGPNLDRGYYRLDLASALGDPVDRRPPARNLVLQAGRDLVQLGTGLTLSEPLDHVSLTLSNPRWRLLGLAGQTIGSSADFDQARTADRTNRALFAAELRYQGLDRHEPFAYVLAQRDHQRELRPAFMQAYDYDSLYVGVGARGELLPRLSYRTEWVYETGTSHAERSCWRDTPIRAWAASAELEYFWPGPRRARASLGYVFGSGDADRTLSPTDSGGAPGDGCLLSADRTDSSFVGMGYRNTGLALAPRYSNLHVWRAGASAYPWAAHRRWRDLQLGTDWFLFHKHQRAGAISDPTADLGSGYVGWEMDYYANWAVTSDLVWTLRTGLFFPGDAYSDRGPRTSVMLGAVWSF